VYPHAIVPMIDKKCHLVTYKRMVIVDALL
jgi:hypothetical protein